MSLKLKLDVYPVENYIQTSVDPEKATGNGMGNSTSGRGNHANSDKQRIWKSPLERLMSLKARCQEEQCVSAVEGVLIAHLHRHPHVILMKQTVAKNRDATGNRLLNSVATINGMGKGDAQSSSTVYFRLPGGRCQRGETEEACLMRKLGRQLLNEPETSLNTGGDAAIASPSDTVVEVTGAVQTSEAGNFFRIGDVLAKWYRPHFSPLMYPYIPAHISASDVKEVRTVFLVHLKPSGYFNLPPETELVAVPLFDLYENAAKYGPVIASLPTLLSRVFINYCSLEYIGGSR